MHDHFVRGDDEEGVCGGVDGWGTMSPRDPPCLLTRLGLLHELVSRDERVECLHHPPNPPVVCLTLSTRYHRNGREGNVVCPPDDRGKGRVCAAE